MAPSVADGVRQIVQVIQGLGLNAAAEPSDLGDLPGVLVYPNTITYERLADDVLDLTADLLLVAGAGPALSALDQLDGLLAALLVPLQLREVRAVTLALPSLTGGTADPLPALQATVQFQITEE